ncbi:histidine-histamine antiporter [Ligilactobacillus ceti]|uniref:Histidine histamine antiporter n=1 Tax=Ligilactobacillus ceti DSM 22408 TaxID=1122146 RepID=A0A0R2KHI9_9LACO|nr:histidine-histamine antiporter [Ligilactobacillus ceti]KRN88848.1 histidine histamine antiporter [Ligilactobacillus ceti DSM 22408]
METERQNIKKLNLFGMIALVMSAMIGSGIFDLPKNMAQVAGLKAQLLAWGTTIVGIWFIAEMFVILSETRPDLTAGLYKYGEVGFGPFVGFFTAWGYFICECFANVAYAVLIMSTFNYFFPGEFSGGNNWLATIGASIITWIISLLVLRGNKTSGKIQKIVTGTTLTIMIIFIVTCLWHFDLGTFFTNMNAQETIPHLMDTNKGSISHQWLQTMMITLWLFGGIEGAVVMSGKARDPKQVPKATILGFVFCSILFACINLLPLGSFSYGQLANMTSPSTAQILMSLWHNNWGRNLITFALLIAILSSWISWVQMLAELPQRAAQEDHTFPKIFAKRSNKDVPVTSVLIATVVMQIIIIMAHYNHNAYQMLLTITGTMTVAPYMVSALFLIKLSWRKDQFPTHDKHSRNKALVIGILAFLYTLIMGYAAGIHYILISFIVYALGIPVYIWARKEYQRDQRVFSYRELVFVIIIIVMAIWGVYTFI